MPGFKICETCEDEKELEVFSVPIWNKDSIDMNICRECFHTLCFEYYNERHNFYMNCDYETFIEHQNKK